MDEAARGTSVTLRALEGEPLRDMAVRDMVEATARAIAERHGMTLFSVRSEPDRITVMLPLPRIAAIGFVAELRRVTTRWYTQKYGVETLWGELREEGDEWKGLSSSG